MALLRPERLHELGEAVFRAAGASPENAARVTEALVDANLAGHDSHGVQHIPGYVRSIKEGLIVADARPAVLRETPVTALVGGGWTFGQVAAEYATRCAVGKAKQAGMAAVGVVQVNHVGRLGEYAEIAAREGVIALIAAGGFAEERGQAVPFGGARAALGTNPIAMGFPTGRGEPMFLDFATTAVAAGKIAVARAKGLPLPEGALVDREGRPTTDPNAYYDGGALLPFGGHKGYALSMAVEFLGRVVTGSETFATEGRGGPYFARSGTMILAFDPGAFGPSEAYRRRSDATIARIKAVPPAAGFQEVLVPGEPEQRSRLERQRDGIPLPAATWEAIRDCATSLGLPDPGEA
ncbi:MAG TPA: Ldh family oxidoreductase [Chloroflexota bacterium]|jgi:LDH2 family malate/lactate/ureidoglycolate dehydrogenase|nr:Ldh family oxidoreductase [Chloroflexota bacterium]